MKLKIDENLPADCAVLLRNAGFEADTVADQDLPGADDAVIASRSRSEDRVLVTLDLDFANVLAYPPAQHAGMIVLRSKRLDKPTVLRLGTATSDLGTTGVSTVSNYTVSNHAPGVATPRRRRHHLSEPRQLQL